MSPSHSSNTDRPSTEIEALAGALPSSSVILDVGCGTGRNSLYLARRGMRVHAFDISESAVREVREEAARLGLNLVAWRQDLKTFTPTRQYNLVVCHGILHFLPTEEVYRVLRLLQRATGPHGFHAIKVFSETSDVPRHLSSAVLSRMSLSSLEQLYRTWRVHLCQEYVVQIAEEGGRDKDCVFIKFVAETSGAEINDPGTACMNVPDVLLKPTEP